MILNHFMFKSEKVLSLSIFSLGLTSIVTQIILLREFLSVFYGNELVIGIVLANWMLLTGTGAYLGKFFERWKIKPGLLVFQFFALAVLPILTVFLLNYLRNLVFIPGSMIGIFQIFYSSLILLLPYCLISGFSFTILATFISISYKYNLIGKVYAIESLGGIIGGIVLNFFLIFFLKTFQSLKVLLVINLVLAVLLSFKYEKKIMRDFSIAVTLIFLVIAFSVNLDNYTRRHMFRNQKLLFYKNTPYGSLAITKQGGQMNFFENNVLLFSTNDPSANEEAVHYAMVQHPDPKNVLLIGGGISGTTKEILKYNVDRVDYVEVNPWIISVGKTFTNVLNDKRINIINTDGRLFVKNTSNKYDVVLINLPEPATAQLNRFYTIEFFGELKNKLNNGAIVSFSLLPTVDYISPETRRINSIAFNTIKKIFKNVLIVPGLKNYFLASDNKLNINIGEMISKRGINNLYVNQYYLDDEILNQRSNYIESNLEEKTKTNKDFNPVSYYRQILYWLSYFKINYWIPAVIILSGLIFLLFRLNTISFGIFCGGFAASSIEILLIIAFQIIYGYVYQATGIIITIFMGGLAAGAYYREKLIRSMWIKRFINIQFGISIYSFILPLILVLLKHLNVPVIVVHSIFYGLTFLIAVLIGLEFSLAAVLESGNFSGVSSRIYGIDLVGSAFGALLVSAFLIPLLGIILVSIVTGLLNFLSGLITLRNRMNYS